MCLAWALGWPLVSVGVPLEPQVVAGKATLPVLSPAGQNSITWERFNIGAGEASRFVSSGGAYQLNRVGAVQMPEVTGALSPGGSVVQIGKSAIGVLNTGGVVITVLPIDGKLRASTAGASPASPAATAGQIKFAITDSRTPGVKVEVTPAVIDHTTLENLTTATEKGGLAGVLAAGRNQRNATQVVFGDGRVMFRAGQ